MFQSRLKNSSCFLYTFYLQYTVALFHATNFFQIIRAFLGFEARIDKPTFWLGFVQNTNSGLEQFT